MPAKSITVSWLAPGLENNDLEDIVSELHRVGFSVAINRWDSDPSESVWYATGQHLISESAPGFWIIVGSIAGFCDKPNRYGLSLARAMVQASQNEIELVCLCTNGEFDSGTCPRLLQDGMLMSSSDPSWAAKLVAATYAQAKPKKPGYRLNPIAHPHLGQWFEVGPLDEQWEGAMFGIDAATTIVNHAIGPRGRLPHESSLEYPSRGFEFTAGDTECNGWAVKNVVGPEDSYFVRVDGEPSKLVFGPHPDSDNPDMFVVPLV